MTTDDHLIHRITLLLQRTQGITTEELEQMPPFALAILWRVATTPAPAAQAIGTQRPQEEPHYG